MGLFSGLADWKKNTFGASVNEQSNPYPALFAVAFVAFFIIAPAQSLQNLSFLIFFAPLYLPPLLIWAAIARYVAYKRMEWHASIEYVLLEIRLPRDTMKTPFAMELALNAIHIGSGEATWLKKYFEGRTRPQFSLEIVSLGGRVHFFVRTRENLRRVVESAIYAQYPGAEIVEAMDYSRLIDPSEPPYKMAAFEFEFKGELPHPVTSFRNFKLEETGKKPEEQMDPLAQIVEMFGSLSPKEQMWVQFVLRTDKNEKYPGKKNAKGKQYSLADHAQDVIKGIRDANTVESEYVDPVTQVVKKSKGFPNLTKGQSDFINAIETKASKPIFEVGIRGIYAAHEDFFQGSGPSSLAGMWKPFSGKIAPAPVLSDKYKDFPWEDRGGKHKKHDMHEAVQRFRRRAFFYDPYVGHHTMLMNPEELATFFHIPSGTVTTPTLPRIQSSTSEAPSNLPV